MQSPLDDYEEALRECIELVNAQAGAYMDALSGFAGHHARVSRQVHRVMRPERVQANPDRVSTVVWNSAEDPTQPDIIINRTVRADEFLASNAPGGANEQQHAKAILVFLYATWELELRPRLASAKGIAVSEVKADIMGDLRHIRNAILHSRSGFAAEDHSKLLVTGELFEPSKPISLPYEHMHRIFVLIKQECARLLYAHLGVDSSPAPPEQLTDIAIQRRGRGHDA